MATTVMESGRHIPLISCGHELDSSTDKLGVLRNSVDIADNVEALRARMQEDGYLYLPGYLDRKLALEARRDILSKLAEEGSLDPSFPVDDGIPGPEAKKGVRADIAARSEPFQELLYSGRMIEFYEKFLGGEVLHYDYTWLRPVPPGRGTTPHGDSVFMNRGTLNLYTAWVPLGDISFELGGLMVLENSHKLERIRNRYGLKDVDSYCVNSPHADKWASGEKHWAGYISKDPFTLRERLGGRWLTTEYRAGDLLTFTMFTLHASLDNHSDRIRLSSDSRYQLASEAADERWVGTNATGHGAASRIDKIC